MNHISARAKATGGNGSGKCTFEVRVDGVADVQIRGNQGYLQTRSGMRAQWVRLKCNQPLPRNPNGFRFAGVDGRGKQHMLRNPSQNNGVAVIRIEDNRNGMQGYTGDVFWNGGSGNWNGGGDGWWQDDWNGGGGGPISPPGNGWSNNIVPNCQKQYPQQGWAADQQCAGEFQWPAEPQSRGIVRHGGWHRQRSRQPGTNGSDFL